MSAKPVKCSCGGFLRTDYPQFRPANAAGPWQARCQDCGRRGTFAPSETDAIEVMLPDIRALRSHDALVDALRSVNKKIRLGQQTGNGMHLDDARMEIGDALHDAEVTKSAEEGEEV